jgi:hypothetical protein
VLFWLPVEWRDSGGEAALPWMCMESSLIRFVFGVTVVDGEAIFGA